MCHNFLASSVVFSIFLLALAYPIHSITLYSPPRGPEDRRALTAPARDTSHHSYPSSGHYTTESINIEHLLAHFLSKDGAFLLPPPPPPASSVEYASNKLPPATGGLHSRPSSAPRRKRQSNWNIPSRSANSERRKGKTLVNRPFPSTFRDHFLPDPRRMYNIDSNCACQL